MQDREFTKGVVYVNSSKGASVRGRPPVTEGNREEEYWRERNGGEMVLAREACKDKDKWRLFYCGHTLDGGSQKE